MRVIKVILLDYRPIPCYHPLSRARHPDDGLTPIRSLDQQWIGESFIIWFFIIIFLHFHFLFLSFLPLNLHMPSEKVKKEEIESVKKFHTHPLIDGIVGSFSKTSTSPSLLPLSRIARSWLCQRYTNGKINYKTYNKFIYHSIIDVWRSFFGK